MRQKLSGISAEGRRARAPGALTAAALVLTATALAGGTVLLPGGDVALTRGLERAVATVPAGEPRRLGDDGDTARLWQSRLDGGQFSTLAGTFAVGDRITVAGTAGAPRVLEVSDVRAWVPSTTYTERAGTPGLTIVTAIVVGEPDARPVRFIVGPLETEPASPAPKSGRTAL